MREQGVDAGLGSDWIDCVECILDTIPFLRNGQDMRVGDDVERIVLFLRAQATAHGEIIVRVNSGCQQEDSDYDSVEEFAHLTDLSADSRLSIS